MVYSQSSHQPINCEQVRQQLAALGYKAGDTVYLRAFYPDSDPRKTKDAGRKAESTKLDQLIKHATTFQAEGRGIYLVVNGGGHKDRDVTQARAIFYEHDNSGNYLRAIGQQFNGDPRQLLEEFAARCNPPLPKRETETVWKSAECDNPSPACKSEGVDNCIRGWYWNNYAKKTSGKAIGHSNNIITHPRFTPPDPAGLREH
jgi:hypothetical protein